MPTNGSSTVLRFIRKLAAGDPRLTDRELLRRFTEHREEAAFEALVARHGPMVMSVCQRLLTNWHDAEDACQATFLVLARKACSHRWQDSVANWLYKTAYQTALRARTTVARRSRHEGRMAAKVPPNPLVEITGQELLEALDEELLKVPEGSRAPLVLCYLEGLTRDEAARQLGCPLRTLNRRLQRGRELLHKALVRRGLTLSAGLVAIMLIPGASKASMPAMVLRQTVGAALLLTAGKPAAGVVSAHVIQLLKGEFGPMMLTKLKGALAILLAVGVTGGASLLTYPAVANRPAENSRKVTAKQSGKDAAQSAALTASSQKIPPEERGDQKADTITVRGRVLDPDGKRFAGAKVYLHDAKIGDRHYSARATSGADGRFELTIAKSELDQPASGYTAGGFATSDYQTSQVMAAAKGYGCGWATVRQVEAECELTLRLVKDVPINGRVIDAEGRPIAGAKVKVEGVGAYPGEDLTKMIEHFRLRGWPGGSEIRWEGELPEQAKVLTTAADGRFLLAGFGRERSVRLIVEGPGIEYTSILVMTRAGEAVLGPKPLQGVRQSKVYGATFDYLAAPSRPIRGVVCDKGTGKPVAGVSLWSYHTTHRPRTDKEGRYEMLGSPKTATYVLYLEPPDGLHFRVRACVSDTLGLEPLTADIALPSGITVHGRVLDQASGKPVPGVRISYYVVFPNPKVGRLDDYHEDGGLSSATSGPDGSYALAVFPGPGVLAAAAQPLSAYRPALITPKELEKFLRDRPEDLPINQDILVVHGSGSAADARHWMINQSQYNALALVKPGDKDKALVRDLELLPALTRKGTIVGPDGKPLSDVMAMGLDNWHAEVILRSATFTVLDLHAARTRDLFFYHRAKNLGRFLQLRGEQSEPLRVEPSPAVQPPGASLIEKANR